MLLSPWNVWGNVAGGKKIGKPASRHEYRG